MVSIKQISDLFYCSESHFFPFNSFCKKFNVKCNFLQYYSILSSIPQNWKKLLQECSKDPVTPRTSICSLSCKAIYSILLNLENLPPPTSEKKNSVWIRKKLPRPTVPFVLPSVYGGKLGTKMTSRS